ncbi:TIGR02391 family protein [Massilia sp. IC2-278]|uniref:TIGR02391 family protein n=1 Tax=Massilia sp. IC2-278 TaxID=2887200 RepID=UPI001E2EE215|nr:TIGR02391 family protein [Massilia sp. IC2-278]MCC2963458.1 TIGR02391 family protein [Massilia sp. IC2-278]
MKAQSLPINALAGIEYIGLHGITSACVTAVTSLINNGACIEHARLLTCGADHAFLLDIEFERSLAVKAGFASGYRGEAPGGLSDILQILELHRVDIEEYVVSPPLMDRLNSSCLLRADLDLIYELRAVRPQRWHYYINDNDEHWQGMSHRLARRYPSSIPFSLIDPRIHDLVADFFLNPDNALGRAYRRLEEIIRKRTGIVAEGQRLFSAAFQVDSSPLTWDVPDTNEAKGRAQLFIGVFAAFRNARAHREIDTGESSELRELLLVNELYRLEDEALTRDELEQKRRDDRELDNNFKF